MKCLRCGAEFESGRFCPNCGLNMEEALAANAAKNAAENGTAKEKVSAGARKIFTAKNILIACAVLVAVILVAVLLRAVFGQSGFEKADDPITVYNEKDGTVYYICGSKQLKGSGFSAEDYLQHGDTGILAANDASGAVRLLTAKGVKETKISNADELLRFSYDGNAIFYRDRDGRYCLYNIKTKKNSVVLNSAEGTVYYVLSPSGKTVLYSCRENGETKLYFFNGRKSVYLGKDATPLSVDDAGRYIYAVADGDTDTLYRYFKSGKDKSRVGEIAGSRVYVNKTANQIIFFGSNGILMSKNGKEATTLTTSATSASIVLPIGARSTFRTGRSSGYYAYMVGTKDLLNALFSSDSTVFRLNKKGERTNLAYNCDNFYWTADEKYVFYAAGGSVFRAKANKSDSSKTLATNYQNALRVSPDGKFVYYNGSDGGLYGIRNGGKARLITSDYDTYCMSSKGYVFYMTDGTLFCCTNARKGRRVADNVGGVSSTYPTAMNLAVYYTVDGEGNRTYYISNGNKNFKVLFKGVEAPD